MQIIANIDQADIGLVEQAKGVKFSVDAFPGDEYTGTIQQLRLNPVSAQNVVTYNVVIDVSNPRQKLKPGMTANLTITIDERNNVVKVPNAALRFTPQDATGQRSGRSQNRNRSQSAPTAGQQAEKPADASGDNGAQAEGRRRDRITPSTSPVLEGQTRRVWVMGQDGKPQPRRIKIGLTDGSSTEVVEGELKEGEIVITGQNISGASTQQSNTQTAPGFGGLWRRTARSGRRRW
jgi:HlyD family secretion protein